MNKSSVNPFFAMYIAAMLLFATNGIVASAISLSSYQIVLFRSLLGGVLVTAIFLAMRMKYTFYKDRKQTLFLICSGISMGVSWMFQYEAYDEIGVGMTSLFYCFGPVFVMMLSPILFKEKITSSKAIGFGTVVIGALILGSQGIDLNGSTFGYFCGLVSALAYTTMVIFNKLASEVKGLESTSMLMIFSFIVVLLFLVFTGRLPMDIQTGDIAPLLMLGLVNTGFGCILYFTSMKFLPSQTIATWEYVEPTAAIIFSVMILSESFTPVQAIGAVLIIGGAVIAESFHKQNPVPTE